MYKIELLKDKEGFVVTATNIDNGNSVDECEEFRSYENAITAFENMIENFKDENCEVEEVNECEVYELLEKKFITLEDLQEIEESDQIVYVEDCGMSGDYAEYHWYVATNQYGEEFTIYVK